MFLKRGFDIAFIIITFSIELGIDRITFSNINKRIQKVYFEINKQVFEQFPELQSERLKFCQISLNDTNALFEIRTHSDVMKYMDTDMMKSIADSEELIKSLTESFIKGEGINWGLLEKSSNTFIGYFGFWRIDSRHCRAEIGYALHPDYWGKGYMNEAASVLIDFGFNTLHLHSVEANINPDNLASKKVLEKIGFVKEAYFRENFLYNKEFKDSVIYSLLESDFIK